jgi:ribosomal protein L37E
MRTHKCTRCGREQLTSYDRVIGEVIVGEGRTYTIVDEERDIKRHLDTLGWSTDPLLCPFCTKEVKPAKLTWSSNADASIDKEEEIVMRAFHAELSKLRTENSLIRRVLDVARRWSKRPHSETTSWLRKDAEMFDALCQAVRDADSVPTNQPVIDAWMQATGVPRVVNPRLALCPTCGNAPETVRCSTCGFGTTEHERTLKDLERAREALAKRDDEVNELQAEAIWLRRVFHIAYRWTRRPQSVANGWLANDAAIFAQLRLAVTEFFISPASSPIRAQPTTVPDQPPPVARPGRKPCWDIVIDYVQRPGRMQNAYDTTRITALVITDMRERDQVGRQRYGVPLTSGNGRNHLVDAYQELLDYVVYLVAELDEKQALPYGSRDQMTFKYRQLNQMLDDALLVVVRLRAFIEEDFDLQPPYQGIYGDGKP